jgi:Ni,Fe-hydrogenase I small subunit
MVGVGRATPAQHPPSTPSPARFPVGQNFTNRKDMRVHYFWEERLFQHPSQSTPIGFCLWDIGRCSSPGTGPTCTKTGQLAVSMIVHKTSNYKRVI